MTVTFEFIEPTPGFLGFTGQGLPGAAGKDAPALLPVPFSHRGPITVNTGPLRFYQSGGGISGATSNSSTQFLTNGVPGREAMHKLAIPLVIENQASFYGQLIGNNYQVATAAARLVASRSDQAKPIPEVVFVR